VSRKKWVFVKSHYIFFENGMAFISPIKQGADDHATDEFPVPEPHSHHRQRSPARTSFFKLGLYGICPCVQVRINLMMLYIHLDRLTEEVQEMKVADMDEAA
jgi:hypothetical protein